MSINTTNYSHKAINAAIKHYEAFVDNSTTSGKTFTINYKLNIDFDRLIYQAKIFAFNFGNHYHMEFEKKLTQPLDKVQDRLFEIYIYSFVKSIHSAMYRNQINNDMSKGLAFDGHHKLYHLLRVQSFVEYKDNISYVFSIDLGDESSKRELFIEIFSRFKFLQPYLNTYSDIFGTKLISIALYESDLLRIKTKIDEIVSKSRNVQQQNINNNENAGNNANESSNNVVTDKKTKKKRSNNTPKWSTVNLNLARGVISVVEFSAHSTNPTDVVTFDKNPILNAFESEERDVLYYIPIIDNKPILLNPSFSFSRANFITVDKNNTNMKWIDRAYHSESYTGKQRHLDGSDVYCNTGIICDQLFILDDDKWISTDSYKKIYTPLSDKFKNLGFKIIVKILTDILNKSDLATIKAEQIEDIYNKYVGPNLK